MSLSDDRVWLDLIKKYEKIDPVAVLDPLQAIVENALLVAKPQRYKVAARHLKRMRMLARDTDRASDVDAFIAALRGEHSRRPRLQTEFDRAGLP